MSKTIHTSCLKHLLFSALLFLLTSNSLSAQELDDFDPEYTYEIGLQVGANAFLGDLGGNLGIGKNFAKDYMSKTARPLLGLSFTYYPKYWYNITGGINYTNLVGADSLIDNKNGFEKWRYNRNLSFRSTIWEGYIGTEIFPLSAINMDYSLKRIRPYLGFGVGVFHFNPQAQYNGTWVDLRPLHLEGEGFPQYPNSKEYSLTQLYLPLSAGIRFAINPKLSLSTGIIFRYTWTDYIDDVSQTYVDPKYFDIYFANDPTSATLAKALYSRSKTPQKVKPGIDRADRRGNNRDSYTTVFLSLRYSFDHKAHYNIGYW